MKLIQPFMRQLWETSVIAGRWSFFFLFIFNLHFHRRHSPFSQTWLEMTSPLTEISMFHTASHFPSLLLLLFLLAPLFIKKFVHLVHLDLLVFTIYFFPTGNHALESKQVKYCHLFSPVPSATPHLPFFFQPPPPVELSPSPSEVCSHFMAICPCTHLLVLFQFHPPPKLLS